MACAFARIGSRVTLIDLAPRVLPSADPEASATLAGALADQGVDVRLRARVGGYDEASGSLLVERPSGSERITGVDAVLLAIGRVPNTEGFVEAVTVGPEGIEVDGWGRTSAAGVWAVGDVTPRGHQTRAANAQGRRVVQRIAFPRIPPLGGPR